MPIYEYRCAKCGEFDMMQRITDKPLRKCPTCKRKVEKLVSNTSFQLKGSGWYLTDYAGKGKAEGASAKESSKSEKESSKPDSGAASAGESKTSTKSEKKGKSTGKSADAA